uniref:Uncharacterized protein n=1 Tax=Kalanchoe fedtschenkoi TaxID=63787 RepID=A0A7N0T330_KALFE
MVDDDYPDDERVRLIKVVEYLEPTMAKELLCKFPDGSWAFDFDYTQSSIWSPVAPRAFKSIPLSELERVLEFNLDPEEEEKKKVATPASVSRRKRHQCTYGMGLVNKSALKRVSRNIKSSVLSMSFVRKKMVCASAPSPAPIKRRPSTLKSSKGWDVVLKAASKHFKKRKKKDEIVHVKLSDNIKNGIL